MAVNMKLGIDVGAFKKGISDANAQLKTFDAQLKFAETSMKSAGNAEQGLVTKTNALEGKLKTQKSMIQQYTRALDEMKSHGVDPLSKEYQQLQAAMVNTQTAMMETEQALNGLDASQQQAANSATQLVNSVNGIGKKMSIEQVITGINSITSGLETAASKAVQLGETIFSAVMDRARWADDTATMALMYGIDLDKFQRMQKLVTNGLDTSVDAMLTAQVKLNKGIGNGTSATMDALRELGLLISDGKYGTEHLITEDSVELFWEAGRALMALSTATDKEATAQALFGRSWKELVPLFDTEHGGFAGLEDYEKALEGVQVNSEEDVNALAELNDKVGELKGNLETLSTDILAKLAPALTEGANALNGMITSLLEYLKTDAGQAMLQRMGDAVSGLFEDLGKIDPQEVVSGFVGVFEQIVNGLQWLSQNSGAVIGALEAVVIGWGALKITGGALEILNLINGISGLGGGSAAAAEAGAAAGTGWGTAFASAVMKAAPWLIGLYTMLNPSETGNNDLTDAAGKMTAEGWGDFYWQRERAMNGETQDNRWWDLIQQASGIVENGDKLWNDTEGIQVLADFANSGDADKLASDLAALGYVLRDLSDAADQTPEGQKYVNGYGPVIHKDRRTGKVIPTIGPEEANGHFVVEDVDIEALLNAKDGKEQIEEQVGTVTIPVTFVPAGGGGGASMGGGTFMYDLGLGTLMSKWFGHHANGIWSVPNDNYLAVLHRGERVMPAREVGSSRNFSSNLYVESMYMNNGTDAAGLASAMAAAQRRTMNGFGS